MMDEPSMSEIIRDIQANVQALIDSQDRYITRERYEADLRLAELQQGEVVKRVAALEERDKSRIRMLMSVLVLPLLVILLAYAMGVRS